jgi:hypothetical protein
VNQIKDRRDFAIVVPSYLDDFGLDPYEYRIYSHIVRRAGKNGCFESIPNMSKHCLISEKIVRRSLKVLLESKLIAIVASVPGKSVVYEITPREEWCDPSKLPGLREKHATITPGKSATTTPGKSATTTPGKSATTTPGKSATTTPGKSATTPLANLPDEVFPSKGVPSKGIPSKVFPLNPQEEKREEVNSGNSNSEIPSTQSIASLTKKSEFSEKQITPHEGNFSAANRANATQQSEKIDPFYKTRLKSQDVMWVWLPDGEWILDGGLNPEFWNWMATSWMSKFNCTIHEAKSNVISHFRKQPEQLVLKWDEYSSQKLKKESFTPLPDAVRDWQQVQHLLIWEQYNNCKDLEHFYSLRSWNRAYLEYALKHLPNFDWSKHLTTISA